MTNVEIERLNDVCVELRRRVARNQPMDTEQLLGTLLVIAESVKALAVPASQHPTEKVPAEKPGQTNAGDKPGQTGPAPKIEIPEQRRL